MYAVGAAVATPVIYHDDRVFDPPWRTRRLRFAIALTVAILSWWLRAGFWLGMRLNRREAR